MESILTLLTVIDWIANEVHYATDTNNNFYSRHLLSDRVRDFGSAEDDIKECYYLGWLREQPPKDQTIAAYAIKYMESAHGDSAIDKLTDAMVRLSSTIETIKKSVDPKMPAGVHAILDEISKKALTYTFLLSKESMNDGSRS